MPPRTDEKHASQIPAVKLLVSMGYEYLSISEGMRQRKKNAGQVLLEDILHEQLGKINRIYYKNEKHEFSGENIQAAIHKLKNVPRRGLLRTNNAVYDLLTLGTTLEQNIKGDSKSFNIKYIDWDNPQNNCFHVTVEYSVKRKSGNEHVRPDIVLFVNGIPLAVIECKAPSIGTMPGVEQSIRNQTDKYIPHLFIYAQLLASISTNDACYATVGSSKDYWGKWKEQVLDEDGSEHPTLLSLVQNALSDSEIENIANDIETPPATVRQQRSIATEQDKLLYALCRPARLLEIAHRFVMFEHGEKKIARYQQYFLVNNAIARFRQKDDNGRKGGVVWHTQGSGKSLTMAMLVRSLSFSKDIVNPRIVLVTDRVDLDKQLKNTFTACGFNQTKRAKTGKNLLKIIKENKTDIITTLIHKFEKTVKINSFKDESENIFVLVDESHRTNFGAFAAQMHQVFPNACFVGFTGTPLTKKDRNSFARFGKLLQPAYSIRQAVADKAVVPLLYEGRTVLLSQDKKQIDRWFERHTQGLSARQKDDLKRKYARGSELNEVEELIYERAFDISEHFRQTWQGTGFKGQLVTSSKRAALRYYEILKEIGNVSAGLLISAPDVREGYEETDADESSDAVVNFWQRMMKKYGKEEEYNTQLINAFKGDGEPEIMIVVDKLLTGFDSPRNTVMYLCRSLRGHTLLQAVARVNRLYEGKEYGFIIDYANVLENLDKAMAEYDALAGFDQQDIEETFISIHNEIAQLAQRHAAVCNIFSSVENKDDMEEYERWLADDERRDDFYECLSLFSKTLAIALSSDAFYNNTSAEEIDYYKRDLARFNKLRESVMYRYADKINYRNYDKKIRKLLDTHIKAGEVQILHEPRNAVAQAAEKKTSSYVENKSNAARADTIAHRTKNTIIEKMQNDPVFYEKFSVLVQAAIDDFHQGRISEDEYLQRAKEIKTKVIRRVHDNIPPQLKKANEAAIAYYGLIQKYLQEENNAITGLDDKLAAAALDIEKIIIGYKTVGFWQDGDSQKQCEGEIDDYLYDKLQDEQGIKIPHEQVMQIIRDIMSTAESQWRQKQ